MALIFDVFRTESACEESEQSIEFYPILSFEIDVTSPLFKIEENLWGIIKMVSIIGTKLKLQKLIGRQTQEASKRRAQMKADGGLLITFVVN